MRPDQAKWVSVLLLQVSTRGHGVTWEVVYVFTLCHAISDNNTIGHTCRAYWVLSVPPYTCGHLLRTIAVHVLGKALVATVVQ